jgi:hypothetical protein
MDEQEEQATSFSPGNFLSGNQGKKGSRDFHDSSPVGVRTSSQRLLAVVVQSNNFFTQQEKL